MSDDKNMLKQRAWNGIVWERNSFKLLGKCRSLSEDLLMKR